MTLKVLFIGSVQFSASVLELLIELQADIVGVCTKSTSTFNADHIDLTSIAAIAEIPVLAVSSINEKSTLAWIAGRRPDVIFCFGWSQIVHKPLLELAPLGVIGFHPAALPANRGRHPIIWALALGLDKTASTFFFMDEGADTGDILSQVAINISSNDDASTLYSKITSVALEQVRRFLPELENGTYIRLKQNHTQSNSWRKRSRPDGVIDWRMSALSIHNLIRALARPYVGAEFQFNGVSIKVWKSELVPGGKANLEPGLVLDVGDGGILVKAGSDCIRLCELGSIVEGLKPGMYL